MAKGKPGRGKKSAKAAGRRRPAKAAAKRRSRRSAKPATKRPARKSAKRPKRTAKTSTRSAATRAARPKASAGRTLKKTPRLDRVRRTLADEDRIPTPPSSLNMDRHGTAARSGRAELERRRKNGMSPELAVGDVDVDLEDAYFTGDETPGGDNPSPDMDVVEDIGKALGVQYDDNEELKSGEKLDERDKHRWELDPASSEDYKDRK